MMLLIHFVDLVRCDDDDCFDHSHPDHATTVALFSLRVDSFLVESFAVF